MKKLLFLVVLTGLSLLIYSEGKAQTETVNPNVYVKENIPAKKPIPYRNLREADIMWSKKIWQIIDCREKMNHIFYYPIFEDELDDRRSLISLLIYGIDNEGLTVYSDEEFREILTRDDVYRLFDALPDTQQIVDPNSGELITQVIDNDIKYDEVKSYEIYEQWFFDRRHSTMRVRILGICPIRSYTDQETQQFRRQKTFYVYFPEVRELLAKQEVFNRNNDANRVSFDDIFMQRRFNSYITQESNVYENRPITVYMSGIHNLMEAERIKQELFEFEHDLWEY